MTITDFPLQDYKKAQKHYEQGWCKVDECLYEFVRQHPGHSKQGYVYAKVCLVNRVYRAYLHLKVPEEIHAERLCGIGHWLDEEIEKLNSYGDDYNKDSCSAVVQVHNELVEKARAWARADLDSFFAKYLHFHCPGVVPIYDNRAWDMLGKYVDLSDINHSKSYYESFCIGFLELYEWVHQNAEVTVRSLDYFLYLGKGQETEVEQG